MVQPLAATLASLLARSSCFRCRRICTSFSMSSFSFVKTTTLSKSLSFSHRRSSMHSSKDFMSFSFFASSSSLSFWWFSATSLNFSRASSFNSSIFLRQWETRESSLWTLDSSPKALSFSPAITDICLSIASNSLRRSLIFPRSDSFSSISLTSSLVNLITWSSLPWSSWEPGSFFLKSSLRYVSDESVSVWDPAPGPSSWLFSDASSFIMSTSSISTVDSLSSDAHSSDDDDDDADEDSNNDDAADELHELLSANELVTVLSW